MDIPRKASLLISNFNGVLNKFALSPSPFSHISAEFEGICDYCNQTSVKLSNTFQFDVDNFSEKAYKNACQDCLFVIDLNNCLDAIYKSINGNTSNLERIFNQFVKVNQLEISSGGFKLNELISIAFSMRLLIKDDPFKLKCKRIGFRGYFSNWGHLVGNYSQFSGSKRISNLQNIIQRLEYMEFVPKKSIWFKNVHMLKLQSLRFSCSVDEVCQLFFTLEKLNIQFPDLIIKHKDLFISNQLSVANSISVLNALVYNQLNLVSLSRHLVDDLEQKNHEWNFSELCFVCYDIFKLNISTSLFEKLRKLSIKPNFSTHKLEKQLDICSKLGIKLDLTNLGSKVDLMKCDRLALLSLIDHDFVNTEILVKRLPQFNCDDLANLSLSLIKLPQEHAVIISTHILYNITTISHKLTLSNSVKLLKGLRGVGISSNLLDAIIGENIYNWRLFEPPNIENYECWRYLQHLNKFSNLPNCTIT